MQYSLGLNSFFNQVSSAPRRQAERLLLLRGRYGTMQHKRYNKCFFCPCNRVENQSGQKKAAAETKMVKEEDPYGGSTDENTDAEAEQDHPIPELPGTSVLLSASSRLLSLF